MQIKYHLSKTDRIGCENFISISRIDIEDETSFVNEKDRCHFINGIYLQRTEVTL